MSIKTSKRIALGVIASLVFAPFAAVAPASAAGTDEVTTAQVTGITTATGATALTTAAGTAAGTVVTVAYGAVTQATAGTITISAAVTSKPVGSTASIAWTAAAADAAAGGTTFTPAAPANPTITGAFTGNATADSSPIGTVAVNPSAAGSYTVEVWHDQNRNGTRENGEQWQSFTITAGTAASGLTEFALSNVTTNNAMRVSAVSVNKKNPSGRVGVPAIFHPAFTATINAGTQNTTQTNTHKATLRYSVASPTGTAVTVYVEDSAVTTSTSQVVAGVSALVRASATVSASYTTPQPGTAVQFTPTVAGDYVVTIWHDANNDTLQGAGEIVGTSTFTIVADATPNATITQYGTVTGSGANDSFGKLVKVCLTNGTVTAGLNSVETLAVSFSVATTTIDNVSIWSAGAFDASTMSAQNATTYTLTRANFDGAGCAYMNVFDTAAAPGTSTMTLTGAGGTVAGYTNTAGVAFISASAFPETAAAERSAVNFKNGDGTYSAAGSTTTTATTVNNATATWYQPLGESTTMNLRSAVSGIEKSLPIRVIDTSGVLTGLRGAIYVMTSTTAANATGTAATLASFNVTATLGTGQSYQMILPGIDSSGGNVADKWVDGGVTVTVEGLARSANTVTATPSLIRAVAGAKNTTSVQVLDQYGDAIANVAVTPTIAGRNATTGTPAAKITDANGRIAYDFTDASTSTVLLQDVVTFTTAAGQSLSAAAKTGTFTVNYGAAVAAATVTVTGGATEDIAPARTESPISTAAAGADAAGFVTMTAVLKDAAGNTLPAGVAVTWTTSLANTGIVNNATEGDLRTTYTDGAGKATTKVFSWTTGTTTITATAGSVTGTGTIHFVNAASDARVVSATVSGNLITAKVVDRYGNPVKGVSITATRTAGPGYLSGTFPTSASQATIADGTVTFATAGGAATFTIETTTPNDGQTGSAAGKVGATTITAGSIGESLAPIGVSKVTVSIAAPPVVVPEVVYDKPTLSIVQSGGRVFLSGTAEDGEGDIIIYVKRVGTTAWKERAKTLEVAAPGDFNGSIKAPRGNVVIRVKQEGTGLFSNQVIIVK